MGIKRILLYILISVLILSAGCRNPVSWLKDPNDYFITGNTTDKKRLTAWLAELETIEDNNEKGYTIIQQIINTLLMQNKIEKLNLFLTTYVEKNSDDPFNAYYLYAVAQNYVQKEAYPFAAHYFERILKNYQDLSVKGKSIHFVCLSNLINYVEEPVIRIDYYKELLARFGEDIDKGPVYYRLAETYEALGEWELSIQAYKNFLKYDCTIPGEPDAHDNILAKLAYYNYGNKTWTEKSLDTLVANVRKAINTRNAVQLNRYGAKVNFFTRSWDQEKGEINTEFLSWLSFFLQDKPYASAELDKDSNLQEAYLRTTGWTYRIGTWYFYFRRVIFPADPEIHGEWEWQGIYFGEKPFMGS